MDNEILFDVKDELNDDTEEKLLFEEPELEFIVFSGADIVTASSDIDTPIWDPDNPDDPFIDPDDPGDDPGDDPDEPVDPDDPEDPEIETPIYDF